MKEYFKNLTSFYLNLPSTGINSVTVGLLRQNNVKYTNFTNNYVNLPILINQ